MKPKIDWKSASLKMIDIKKRRMEKGNNRGKVEQVLNYDTEFFHLPKEVRTWINQQFRKRRELWCFNSYTPEAKRELKAEIRKLINEYQQEHQQERQTGL